MTSSCVPDLYVAEERCVPQSLGCARGAHRCGDGDSLGLLDCCGKELSFM